MGKRGPQPQPAELKQLRGNPGKRSIPNVPKAQAEKPECPADLATVKPLWDHYGDILASLGILRATDGLAYEMLWRTWSEYMETLHNEDINETVENVDDLIAIVKSKMDNTKLRLSIMRAILPLLDRFGMNPSSRSSLNIEAPKTESEFEKFRNRAAGS